VFGTTSIVGSYCAFAPRQRQMGFCAPPRGPVVRRDRHRYERRRAMLVAAGRIDAIPRRQQVCVWRGGIGGHGRLPVVGRGVHDPRAHPPRRGARSRDDLATELAGSLRLLERLDALGGLLRLLLELLRALGPRALAFALGLRLGLLCPCLGASGLRARAAAVSRVIASEGKVPQHYGQENKIPAPATRFAVMRVSPLIPVRKPTRKRSTDSPAAQGISAPRLPGRRWRAR
jgi:hypothetical protein